MSSGVQHLAQLPQLSGLEFESQVEQSTQMTIYH